MIGNSDFFHAMFCPSDFLVIGNATAAEVPYFWATLHQKAQNALVTLVFVNLGPGLEIQFPRPRLRIFVPGVPSPNQYAPQPPAFLRNDPINVTFRILGGTLPLRSSQTP